MKRAMLAKGCNLSFCHKLAGKVVKNIAPSWCMA
jgi:hypothetical protein